MTTTRKEETDNMKIRNDYVSNSSSSSFIVSLPNDYEFKKFIKDSLFVFH